MYIYTVLYNKYTVQYILYCTVLCCSDSNSFKDFFGVFFKMVTLMFSFFRKTMGPYWSDILINKTKLKNKFNFTQSGHDIIAWYEEFATN